MYKKRSIFTLKLYLGLTLIAFTSVSKGNDFRGIPWGSPTSVVKEKLGKIKSYAVCMYSETLTFDDRTADVLIDKNEVPGLKWKVNDTRAFPQQYEGNFKVTDIGDACEVFFKNKLVAGWVSPSGVSNEQILQELEKKYGKFNLASGGGFLSGPGVYFLSTPKTNIYFSEKPKRALNKGSAYVIYLSNTHKVEMQSSLERSIEKEKNDRKMEYEKSQKKLGRQL